VLGTLEGRTDEGTVLAGSIWEREPGIATCSDPLERRHESRREQRGRSLESYFRVSF